MKPFLPFLLTCVLCMSSLLGKAQTVSVDFDNKVIYTDSLNMPESTITEYIVSILPELLERPGEYTLNDYEVKIEDMPVGNAIDAVMTQIRFCDIEKIEISESPLSSFQNDSKSGSINIILKKRNTEQKPYWGSVSVDVTAPTEVEPSVSFGYKKDKLMVRALVTGNYEKITYDTDYLTFDGSGNQLSKYSRSCKDKFWANIGTLFVNYDATPKDKFLFRTSILKSNEKQDNSETIFQVNKTSNSDQAKTDIHAYFKYTHCFAANNQLEFGSQYNHHPQRIDVSETDFTVGNDQKSDDLSGQLKLKLSLLPADSKCKSFLHIGSNANMSFGNVTANHIASTMGTHQSDDILRSRGLTPFVESENTFGQFRVKLVANCQYYHYDFRREGYEKMSRDNTDLAGKVMAEWHFKKGQMFRLIGDHQIRRPTEMMIYPQIVEDVTNNTHVMGNMDLKNTISNSFTLDYFYSSYWGESSLTMNVSGSCYHISNIINQVEKEGADYYTYDNVGTNNMLVGMFMAMYKYKMVSLTVTADYYSNYKKLDMGDDHYRYFDISLMPTFKTKTNWMGSMRIKYFSPVDTETKRLGSCAGVSFQIGKSWGNFNVHAFGNVSLLGRTTDISYSERNYRTESTTDILRNAAGVGVRYSF